MTRSDRDSSQGWAEKFRQKFFGSSSDSDQVRALEKQLRTAEERAQAAEQREQVSQRRCEDADRRSKEAAERAVDTERRNQETISRLQGDLQRAERRAQLAEQRAESLETQWVVRRREVQMTKKVLGGGGWGVVKVAKLSSVGLRWQPSHCMR